MQEHFYLAMHAFMDSLDLNTIEVASELGMDVSKLGKIINEEVPVPRDFLSLLFRMFNIEKSIQRKLRRAYIHSEGKWGRE